MAKETKKKEAPKPTTKAPKEASNIFHSIMKASVKESPKPNKNKQ